MIVDSVISHVAGTKLELPFMQASVRAGFPSEVLKALKPADIWFAHGRKGWGARGLRKIENPTMIRLFAAIDGHNSTLAQGLTMG